MPALPRPAVFFDRDGTLIEDQDYPSDPAGVRLLPGAAEAVARLNRAGVPVVVVTNQSGIGRGYFSPAQYRAVQAEFERQLAAAGARLDAVYACPHAPDDACACRKPALGMYRQAAEEHGLELAASFYVGDRVRDVEPAFALGGTGLLLVQSPEPERRAEALAAGALPVADAAEAAERVLRALQPARAAG